MICGDLHANSKWTFCWTSWEHVPIKNLIQVKLLNCSNDKKFGENKYEHRRYASLYIFGKASTNTLNVCDIVHLASHSWTEHEPYKKLRFIVDVQPKLNLMVYSEFGDAHVNECVCVVCETKYNNSHIIIYIMQ